MKLITFSIWGSDPKYSVGALRNAILAQSVYPDWICRYYVSSTVSAGVITELRALENVQVVEMGVTGDWRAAFWRFLPAAEDDVKVLISRDTDSRLASRERAAVDEWLASDKDFHIMRDHPWHSSWPILAGMWGVRNRLLDDMKELLDTYSDSFGVPQWGVDQFFLGNVVHPLVRAHAMVHDEISDDLPWDSESDRRRFPTARDGYDYVGQVFDENDAIDTQHLEALKAVL